MKTLINSPERNKWQVRIAALIIFALGFTAGALSWNIYQKWRPASPVEARRNRYEQLLDSLKLSPDQRAAVEKILSEARARLIELRKQSEPSMREVRQQTDERLQMVLTPEQWEQFQRMRAELRARSRYGREAREGGR
jgi:Spy/CpxP family protein refolding chaperone